MPVKNAFYEEMNVYTSQAGISVPASNGFLRKGGKEGKHTEHLGHILAEMQFLPRAYPDAKW
jgi:ring-1,2-phenylacetyl-CoA epoxidase subunit PaaC